MLAILSRPQRVKAQWLIYIYVSAHLLNIGSIRGLFPIRSQAITYNKDEVSHM